MLYYIGLTLNPFLLILCIFGFIKRKQYDTAHSFIFYAIIFALVSEVGMKLSGWYFKTNIVIYNISSLIEFLIFFLFYFIFLGKKSNKTIFVVALLVFVTFYSLEFLQKGLNSIFSYSFLYKNSILLVLAVVAMPKITGNVKATLITNYSMFWVNTAVLVYYSCTLFIFGLRKYTLHLPSLTLVATYLHLFFIFVFYGMLAIGLWKADRNWTSS
jgi:hypothetical protein